MILKRKWSRAFSPFLKAVNGRKQRAIQRPGIGKESFFLSFSLSAVVLTAAISLAASINEYSNCDEGFLLRRGLNRIIQLATFRGLSINDRAGAHRDHGCFLTVTGSNRRVETGAAAVRGGGAPLKT